MPRTSRPLRIDASDTDVRLTHPRAGDLVVEARVWQRVDNGPQRLFSRGAWRSYGLMHAFALEVTPEGVATANWLRASPAKDRRPARVLGERRAELWGALRSLGDVAPPRRRVFTDARLLVARAVVEEIPSRWVAEIGRDSWFESLSDGEDFDAPMYRAVDRLREVTLPGVARRPLSNGGSLHVLRLFEVHPAFAGQLLGARLLAHALWVLMRHPGDLVYLAACPGRALFTRTPLPRQPSHVPAAAIRSLVAYYRRLGFTRAERGPMQDGTPVPMYRHVGAFG
ncbi:MAG: GNAT family N-acetyltransferase [Gemmatimonadaceae bacterium]